MDRNWLGRLDTVACDDPDAANRVVNRVLSPLRSRAQDVCQGHPNGESHIKSRDNSIEWAICAVPL